MQSTLMAEPAAAQVSVAPDALPLAGLTVIEISVARAGPSAGRTLADWGADVVRVEPPEAVGQVDQVVGDRFGSDRMNLHRNKRSLTLNLKSPEGRAIFMDLARKADVILENMRPDVKTRLGIDYDSVAKVNPRIVYGSISGFGQSGPYRDWAGVDQIAQGMGGLMSVTGLPGQGPVRAGTALVDLSAGAYLVQAVLMALVQRSVTGKGRWVHTSLLESIISLMDFQAARYVVDGEVPGQAGNNHPTAVPSGLFETADGHIQIAATGASLFGRFCKLAGAEHMLTDPRFATPEDRLAHCAALNAEIDLILKARPSAEWIEIFSRGGVPCGPVYRMDQTFADPQVRHLGMLVEAEVPGRGPVPLIGSPVNFDGLQRQVRRPPPRLGEHTDAILKELGLSEERIAGLHAQHVV